MTCQRCQGLMVEDHFLDMEESYGRPWIRGWRCVTCGDVIDPLIKKRRILQYSRNKERAAATQTNKRHRARIPIGA